MKFELQGVLFSPNGDITIQVDTAEERIAQSVFHCLIQGLPDIVIRKDETFGYTFEIPDNFMESLEKQKEDYNELLKKNPNTKIYSRLDE